MAAYRIICEKSFVKGYERVPEIYLPPLRELMFQLETDPKNAPKKPKSGSHNYFITRIGEWRVITLISWKEKTVTLVNVESRKNVYK
ncbi:hypothetical protein TNCT_530151 [Trichonephila clavata]|uniref:Type II toxin-antitoxin system RelE/ParE family toxin n=1 Tax=Trichonephila clavata TaxID=2740835 RepID=A0A8X6KWP0_TRICU|nr:hypothetical protein TNCT_530151 [Trichonephila clavata]